MSNWLRHPLTHFEQWFKVVNIFDASFWSKQEPDIEVAAAQLRKFPEIVHSKIAKRTNGEERARYADAALLMKGLLLGFADQYDATAKKSAKAASLIDRVMESHDTAPPDSVVTVVPDRVKRLQSEIKYELNGAEFRGFEVVLFEEMLTHLHDFNWCGRKMFRVEKHLNDELLLTHVDGVIGSFFRLPFQSICIHLPHNEVLRVRDGLIRYMYVSEYECHGGKDVYVMYVPEEGLPFFHEFRIMDNEPIGAQIRAQVSQKYDGYRKAIKENHDAFALIAAMVLYMGSGECDRREMSPSVVDRARDSRLAVCSLGGMINVNRSVSMTANPDGSHTEHTIHILKWAVRGHFRNQPHGQGRKERRLQWIRPYLKGKERGNPEMPMRHTEYQVT